MEGVDSSSLSAPTVHAIQETTFTLPGQTAFYRGKVRDVYTIRDKYLVMVASDRISAFDVVLPKAIPYKGQVLNQIAAFFLEATKKNVPNWVLSVPDPRVTIGWKCEPIPIEMIVRGYLAGSGWRAYREGKREMCGVALPDGLKENDRLPTPILTPTTKVSEGHDEDITREEILRRNIVPKEIYQTMESYALQLFAAGSQMAAKRGLIFVDTKYEFGLRDGAVCLMDEIHTPDSSRYFYLEGYEERQKRGEPQRQLSKEFVRQWLMENGFQGRAGETIPAMNDDIIASISDRYMELFEKVTGQRFVKADSKDSLQQMEKNILSALAKL